MSTIQSYPDFSQPHEFNSYLCPWHFEDCGHKADDTEHICNPYSLPDNPCMTMEHRMCPPCSDENCLPKRGKDA